MTPETLIIVVAVYDNVADTELDHAALRELQERGVVGRYDFARVVRGDGRSLQLQHPQQPKAEPSSDGLATGALLGLMYPLARPAPPRAAAIETPAWPDIFGSQIGEIRELLHERGAGLLVIAEAAAGATLVGAMERSVRTFQREVTGPPAVMSELAGRTRGGKEDWSWQASSLAALVPLFLLGG